MLLANQVKEMGKRYKVRMWDCMLRDRVSMLFESEEASCSSPVLKVQEHHHKSILHI